MKLGENVIAGVVDTSDKLLKQQMSVLSAKLQTAWQEQEHRCEKTAISPVAGVRHTSRCCH
jgi:hypothetical protein